MSDYTELDLITRYDGMLDCFQKKEPESIDWKVDFGNRTPTNQVILSENIKFKCPCCESVFDLYKLLGVGYE